MSDTFEENTTVHRLNTPESAPPVQFLRPEVRAALIATVQPEAPERPRDAGPVPDLRRLPAFAAQVSVAKRGNNYAARGKVIRDAIRRELYRRAEDGERRLDKMVRSTVRDAINERGTTDPSVVNVARREVFDRIDGKPVQQHDVGTAGGPLQVVIAPADLGAL